MVPLGACGLLTGSSSARFLIARTRLDLAATPLLVADQWNRKHIADSCDNEARDDAANHIGVEYLVIKIFSPVHQRCPVA